MFGGASLLSSWAFLWNVSGNSAGPPERPDADTPGATSTLPVLLLFSPQGASTWVFSPITVLPLVSQTFIAAPLTVPELTWWKGSISLFLLHFQFYDWSGVLDTSAGAGAGGGSRVTYTLGPLAARKCRCEPEDLPKSVLSHIVSC